MGKLAGTHFSDRAVQACRNKRRFASEEDCNASIARSNADVSLKAYKCDLCGFWHKTKHIHGKPGEAPSTS
jgi:hypothetical protein